MSFKAIDTALSPPFTATLPFHPSFRVELFDAGVLKDLVVDPTAMPLT